MDLTTLGGYAAVIAVGGGLYYLYTRPGPNRARNQVKKVANKAKPVIEKAKNIGIEKITQEKKGKKKQKSKASTAAPAVVKEQPKQSSKSSPASSKVNIQDDDDGEPDDRAFAQQLAAAQKGQVGPAQSQTGSKQKSVKQSKLSSKKPVVAAAQSSTSASSEEVDDESSAAEDATTTQTPRSNDVSDMLEAPQAGPTTLKITSPTQPTTQKVKKAAAAPAQPLTKTQKKNKKKNEERSAQREADEAERKKLEETQRRTARIAEGRAAKDGSAFQPAALPKEKVWEESPATNGHVSTISQEELLDTFEPARNVEAAAAPKTSSFMAGVPSEDEQMRLLNESLTEWQDVPSKKSKKAVSAGNSEKSQPIAAPAVQENVKPVARENMKPVQKAKPTPSRVKEDEELAQWAAPSTTFKGFAEADEWEVS